jgi:FkbM family methyltransferase
MQLPNNPSCNLIRKSIDWTFRKASPTIRYNGVATKVHSLTQLGAVWLLHRKNFGYNPSLLCGQYDHICDLGANVGLFSIWIQKFGLNSKVKGLLIEANPLLIPTCTQNIKLNNFDGYIVNGLVGDTEGYINVSPSDQSSAVQKSTWLKTQYTDVLQVPNVVVSKKWKQLFGDNICDLMKIDIEGSEEALFRNEGDFIRDNVRELLVEWHHPRTTMKSIVDVLLGLNFVVYRVKDMGDCGLIYAANRSHFNELRSTEAY